MRKLLFGFLIPITLMLGACRESELDNPIIPEIITYTISPVDGGENTATTGIEFTFSNSIDGLDLSAADIFVSGAAKKGSATFTSSGENGLLSPITVNSDGIARVAIIKTGIEEGTKTVPVFKQNTSVPDLAGTVSINQSGTVTVNTPLTVTYIGTEPGLTYQWFKDGLAIDGASGVTYTPTTVGIYTVTVSANGFNPKTSGSVTVTDPSLGTFAGTLTINPNTSVTTGMELTAFYSGTETVSYQYQWKKDGNNVGINSNKFTPTEIGNYTVTISATNYNPKTSDPVTVTNPSLGTFAGTLTINPNTGVTTGTELTAAYNGSETATLTYQWKKDGNNVGINSNKFTPTEIGNYTVTISAANYNLKTSDPVTVTNPSLGTFLGTLTISPNTGVTTGTELTAAYNGSETATLTYQWKKDGNNVGINSNKFTPTEIGNYTVTISAANYNPKTSGPVTVTNPSLGTFAGTLTISPNTGVTAGMELTAAYNGSETATLTYQWKKDGNNIGINSNKFTPTETGSYTVTISAANYNPKTSDPVAVAAVGPPDLAETAGINPSGTVVVNTPLTVTYNGTEPGLTYQWFQDGIAIGGANGPTYTPTEAGIYTVMVSAAGFNPKTGGPVTVIDNGAGSTLNGTVRITPVTAEVGTELAAAYDGSEQVSFQWRINGVDLGEASTNNPNRYVPNEEGSYTVTISRDGYLSKTSDPVTVSGGVGFALSGTVRIIPNPATTGTQLTAVYDGIENVTYQWKKDGNNVGTNSHQFTPNEAGNYTVTVSSSGYKSKTSDPVTVSTPGNNALSGNISISPASATAGTQLTATYTGGETVTYQWKRDGINIGANAPLFTADTPGNYTVTVSGFGYDSKTSNTVRVTGYTPSQTIMAMDNTVIVGGPAGPNDPNGATKQTNDIDAGAIHNLNKTGAYVEFTQVSGNGGRAQIRFSYAKGDNGNATLQISVNGQPTSLVLQPTGGWGSVIDSATVDINLNSGNGNTIRLSGAGVNIASMSVSFYQE